MMADYPNPYLKTDFQDYQDPYSSSGDFNTYYNQTDNSVSSETYSGDSYGDSKDDYGDKYECNGSSRYDTDRYDTDRYSNHENTQGDRCETQEERDRQNRRNRSERRRHMRREDGRRDDRKDDRRDERKDDRRDDRKDDRRDERREERGRDRDREDRGRDRDRESSRSDRDKESTRSRDHSRDSERSIHSERDRDRERERERERERDRREDDRAGEKWVTDAPTNTILLRGLPTLIEEKDIRAELMLFGAPIKDVRLMRKSSGASRGFAFVEFQSVDDALRWMDTNQKTLVLQNQYSCSMNFSTPKDRHDKSIVHKMDWNCSKCGAHNFKRRDHCFGCNLSRHESGKSQADGYDHVGTNPCNTLLFRGLDALTTEENLLRALNGVTQHTCKNIQVIRDTTSQMSAGYAFVELSSVAESMNILDLIKALKPGFEVDGKQILVSFAKNTFNTSIATIAASSQQQTWDQAPTSEYYQGYDYSPTGYDQSSYYSGQYYDGQGYDYSGYYETTSTTTDSTPTVTTTSTSITSTSTNATNAAAAVAQAAIQQAQAAKNYQKQVQKQKKIAEMTKEERLAHQAQEWKQKTQDQPESTIESTKYPPPDVSLYQFDESSGYYYDPVTTLYYDANSQYYYNGNTGKFLYWDSEQSTYLPAPTDYEDFNKSDKTDEKEDKKDTKEKREKVKVAKKIAKDMEKWAKSMNAQKEAVKDGMRRINLPNMSGRKESATADAGFAILEKAKNTPGEDKKLMPPPPPIGGGETSDRLKAGLVASYGGDSDDEDEDGSPGEKVFDETKLLDLNKMACLLCKRQFQSKDQLTKHTQMSNLHKQNMESMRQAQSSDGGSAGLQYRDRAKERREKIGSTAPPPRKRPAVPEPFEQPTKAGIGDDNIGSKMLQKMGWSSGQGLGKKSQGIVNPIQAQRRSATAGLGMRGSNYNIEDTDNYKDALRKTMFARYQEIE